MGLILEFLLTVSAWRKGWGVRALLPLGLCVLFAVVIGGAVGLSGGDVEQAMALGLLGDVLCIAALIGLNVRAPQVDQAADLGLTDVPKDRAA